MTWEAAMRWALAYRRSTGCKYRVFGYWVRYGDLAVQRRPGEGPGRWAYAVTLADGTVNGWTAR